MTVAQLAQRIGASRNTITNYETGKTEPTASDLVRIATALGCGIQELLQPESAAAPPRFAFRAHAALKKNPSVLVAASKFFRAYAEIEEITQTRLPDRLRPFIRGTGTSLGEREIEELAENLRRTCGIHDTGPENIASAMEGLGVRCLFFKSNSTGLDGVSAIQGDMIFMMLKDRDRNVERVIFSGAHELGHLVLHPHLFTEDEGKPDASRDVEEQANNFAGCFLVPGSELMRMWHDDRLERLRLFHALLLLKRSFHVSFFCLFYRLKQLGLTRTDYPVFVNEIKTQLGLRGKAKVDDLEPQPLDSASICRTTRFETLVRSAFLEELIGVAKVAEVLQVSVEDAQERTAVWLEERERAQRLLVEEAQKMTTERLGPKDVLVEDSPV
jgi:Zn-dependent peptidase ImmA (M78 family)/DNA-binding XRE family transcriptional regulator